MAWLKRIWGKKMTPAQAYSKLHKMKMFINYYWFDCSWSLCIPCFWTCMPHETRTVSFHVLHWPQIFSRFWNMTINFVFSQWQLCWPKTAVDPNCNISEVPLSLPFTWDCSFGRWSQNSQINPSPSDWGRWISSLWAIEAVILEVRQHLVKKRWWAVTGQNHAVSQRGQSMVWSPPPATFLLSYCFHPVFQPLVSMLPFSCACHPRPSISVGCLKL